MTKHCVLMIGSCQRETPQKHKKKKFRPTINISNNGSCQFVPSILAAAPKISSNVSDAATWIIFINQQVFFGGTVSHESIHRAGKVYAPKTSMLDMTFLLIFDWKNGVFRVGYYGTLRYIRFVSAMSSRVNNIENGNSKGRERQQL